MSLPTQSFESWRTNYNTVSVKTKKKNGKIATIFWQVILRKQANFKDSRGENLWMIYI